MLMGPELPNMSVTFFFESSSLLLRHRPDDDDDDDDTRAQCAASSNASYPLPMIAIVAPCDDAMLDSARTDVGSNAGIVVVDLLSFDDDDDDDGGGGGGGGGRERVEGGEGGGGGSSWEPEENVAVSLVREWDERKRERAEKLASGEIGE